MARSRPVRQDLGVLFRDILRQDDVHGVMLFSLGGDLIYKEFLNPPTKDPETRDWWPHFIDSMSGVREADLLFEHGRLYIRRTDLGYLLVLMGSFAPVALVRLTCDTLLPALNGSGKGRRRRGFFRKQR